MIGTVPPSALHAAPGDVGGSLGREERDHGGDLLRLGESAERPAGADLREHLRALSLLIGETAVAEPGVRRRRAGRDRVAADPVGGVGVGNEPGERQDSRLRDRVVRHPHRRTLPRSRGDVDDRAPAGTQVRQCRPDRPDVAHHVQVPRRVPVRVRHVLEGGVDREADVVHQDVEAAERTGGVGDDACRCGGVGEIRLHVRLLADSGRVAPPARGDTGALGDEEPRRLEADAAGRAGDETHLPLEAEIHRRLA